MYIVQTSEKNISKIIDILNKNVEVLKKVLEIDINIAIGAEFHSYNFQYQSYTEALKAVEHGTENVDFQHIKISRPQDFKSLFSHINSYELTFFAQSILGDLYEADSKNYADYRDTLRKWLMNKTDVSKTAREMYIHRNTVIYRLERCKEILNSDLNDPDELFNLEIALNLLEM